MEEEVKEKLRYLEGGVKALAKGVENNKEELKAIKHMVAKCLMKEVKK